MSAALAEPMIAAVRVQNTTACRFISKSQAIKIAKELWHKIAGA
jgi:hypothetical protein